MQPIGPRPGFCTDGKNQIDILMTINIMIESPSGVANPKNKMLPGLPRYRRNVPGYQPLRSQYSNAQKRTS
jgi:hypothetical protein